MPGVIHHKNRTLNGPNGRAGRGVEVAAYFFLLLSYAGRRARVIMFTHDSILWVTPSVGGCRWVYFSSRAGLMDSSFFLSPARSLPSHPVTSRQRTLFWDIHGANGRRQRHTSLGTSLRPSAERPNHGSASFHAQTCAKIGHSMAECPALKTSKSKLNEKLLTWM